jgi:peptide deformylase
MIETMKAEGGVGLAANQVGDTRAVAVVEVPRVFGQIDTGHYDKPIVLVNPILYETENPVLSKEGCLSLPGIEETVKRFDKIKVKYQNVKGEQREIDAMGLMAFCIQHELDHLAGKTFMEKASKLKKSMIIKRLRKIGAIP